MQLMSSTKTLISCLAVMCAGLAHAQSTDLSYSGYSVGYIHTTRSASTDLGGVNFSGSFKLNDTFFAAGNMAAQNEVNRGRIGLGLHAPVPMAALKDVDLYAIVGAARNTTLYTGSGSYFSAGAKTMLAPKWELDLMGTYTDINSKGIEKETSVSLGYSLSKDLVLRARSFNSSGVQGYELGLGSRF